MGVIRVSRAARQVPIKIGTTAIATVVGVLGGSPAASR